MEKKLLSILRMEKKLLSISLIGVMIVAIAETGIAIVMMTMPDEQAAPEESMLSETVEVVIGEEVTLPLAENWTVRAESLWINKDDYENWDFSNLSNAEYIIPHRNIGERVNLWLSTDNIVGKPISLSVGEAGIFYDFSNGKVYIIIFEYSGRWPNEPNLWVRLRIRQL